MSEIVTERETADFVSVQKTFSVLQKKKKKRLIVSGVEQATFIMPVRVKFGFGMSRLG